MRSPAYAPAAAVFCVLIPSLLSQSPPAGSVAAPRFDSVRRTARAEIASSSMPGLAVAIVHDGQVVFAEGFGVANVESGVPVTPDTVFQVGSVGKMLTAAAVLETAAAGTLALSEPVGRHVRGLDPVIAALTPHQLLAHVSGLRDMPGGDGELGDDAHGRFVRTLTSADRILLPGQTFSYSNIGYSLAGFAASEAANVPFAMLVRQRVFAPAGMTRSSLRPNEAMTWPLAVGHQKGADGRFTVVRPMAHDTRLWPAGYVFTTAADLARFAMALLGEGRLGGRAVFSAETPRRMMEPHVELPNIFEGGHYGYATFQFNARGYCVMEHAGTMVGSAAILRMVPGEQLAVIALANAEVPPAKTIDAAMEAMLPPGAPSPVTPDGPPFTMSSEEIASYAGRYENRGHFVLTVDKGVLVLRQNDGPPLVVSKVGPNRFVAAGRGNRPRLRFRLERAAAGRPAYLHFALWGFKKTA